MNGSSARAAQPCPWRRIAIRSDVIAPQAVVHEDDDVHAGRPPLGKMDQYGTTLRNLPGMVQGRGLPACSKPVF